MVSSYLPYPLFSGGHIRLFNLLKELSVRHKITLICEKRDYQTDRDVKEIGKLCQKVITVPRKKQWSAINILKTGFSCFPFLMVGHTHPAFKEAIIQELEGDSFDLLHVETFYVMQNLPPTELPLVLAEQNIEYLVYKRFTDQVSFFLKPVLLFDVFKIRYWEKNSWQKANHLIVMSEDEKKIIKKNNVTVVPNGVDIKKYQISKNKYQISKKKKTILFIGNFRWLENRDAVKWLLTAIWPMIKSKVNNLGLWIVGKEIPESIRKLTNDETVIFDENAPDDTALIYQKADLLLAPIRVGGGTSFKILEAMASGVPVVTTSLGIEGIEAEDGKEVLIADEVEGLVKKTINLLEDRVLYEKLVREARVLIKEKYDWRIIARKLESVYQSVTR